MFMDSGGTGAYGDGLIIKAGEAGFAFGEAAGRSIITAS